MAGVKGRSGRVRAPFQQIKQEVIDKSWRLINKSLDDESLALSVRVDIAKPIVIKNMPQAIETPNGIQITLGGILSAAARSKNDSRSVEAMARQSNN